MFILRIIPKCLSRILGQMWEELTAQVINLGHFLCLRRVAKPTVRMIKPTQFWAAPSYYRLTLPVYKATLPIALT